MGFGFLERMSAVGIVKSHVKVKANYFGVNLYFPQKIHNPSDCFRTIHTIAATNDQMLNTRKHC